MVFTCLPRRTMACSTTNLSEEFFSFLKVLGRGIAGSRNRQAAMPYHQILILCIGHLGFERLAGQVDINILLQIARVPFGMSVRGVHAVDIFRETSLHLRSFDDFVA